MGTGDPADFYTGLVAELYGVLRSADPDPAPYERFVRRWGEPALELACGDGDPLLDLVASGLDVHGLDSSADMLDRCRRRAADRRIGVTLHHGRMQSMSLPYRYRCAYLAGASFNLLPDDEAALGALRRLAAHLLPGGAALVPLFVPGPAVGREPTSQRLPDGSVGTVQVVGGARDEGARTQVTVLRYERRSQAGEVDAVEREWLLHWHLPEGFAALAVEAGLDVAGQRALDGSDATGAGTWTALLRQPG